MFRLSIERLIMKDMSIRTWKWQIVRNVSGLGGGEGGCFLYQGELL